MARVIAAVVVVLTLGGLSGCCFPCVASNAGGVPDVARQIKPELAPAAPVR